MGTSFDVRFWQTEVRTGARGRTYRVVWVVDGRRFRETFRTSALAESFRSGLVSAARKGEGFDTDTGLPVSMRRAGRSLRWYELACRYVDLKWPHSAATTRRTNAEVLTAATVLMLSSDRGKPDDKELRRALVGWAFNTSRRDRAPDDVRAVLRWVAASTRPVTDLARPEVLRQVLDGLRLRLDGKPAAVTVVARRRQVMNTVIEYAVELEALDSNPIPALRWKKPKASMGVDRRRVVNPAQARDLLEAVARLPRSGPRLVAYFGCLYYAALRPEEAAALNMRHLDIPAQGWGWLHLDAAEPHAGSEWTDAGTVRDRREQLKHREHGEGRSAPCPPELTALLQAHLAEFGTGSDGRIFRGERNDSELPRLTVVKAWRAARAAVFPPEVLASPLAERPYDLRHAAVSGWLNAGVPATDVAEWAGHSVEVLLRIYAKCLDGGTAALRARVDEFLRQGPAAKSTRAAGGAAADGVATPPSSPPGSGGLE